MSFKRFPFEVPLTMIEFLVSDRDVGWTRNGLRVGSTSSGMDELLKSSRKVWTYESEWAVRLASYMGDVRASRLAAHFFFRLAREVYEARVRRELANASQAAVSLSIGLHEL